MSHQSHPPSYISPIARIAYLGFAILIICMAISISLRHPLQTTMNVLAPIPMLLLAATNSYRSITAKFALAAALLLIAVMIAQPFLHPQPWRF